MKPHFRLFALAALGLFGAPVALLARTASLPPGDTVSINYGDPTSAGTATTSFNILYDDAQGAQQSISISVPISVTASTTPSQKREAVQSAVNTALDGQKVGGQPLATTSGGAEHLAIHPASDTAAASNVKIKQLKAKDQSTGETDKVTDGTSARSIAILAASGNVTGQNSTGGASWLAVGTNQGTTTISLSGSMRAIDLIQAAADGLRSDGEAEVWQAEDEGRIYVLIDKTDITWASIASNDTGLSVSCTMLSTD
jgi:hypothetical protein